MSMREALEDLAKDMEQYRQECIAEDEEPSLEAIKGWYKQIRAILKSSVDVSAPAAPYNDPAFAIMTHRTMIEKAKEQMRAEKFKESVHEEPVASVYLADGPDAGTLVNINPNMPVSGECEINGVKYRKGLDGQLHLTSDAVFPLNANVR